MTAIAGSVSVITGGASGIGRGIAEEFLARGSTVVIADVEASGLWPGKVVTDFAQYVRTSARSPQTQYKA